MPDSQSSPLGRYFDHNGSTPLHPDVLRLCQELSAAEWGNSAASHPMGQGASKIIEEARASLAVTLHATPEELFFTSGGTESNNWALFGVAATRLSGHIVVSGIEHKSVLNAARELQSRGYDLTVVPPREDGAVHLRDLQSALTDETFLVSIMWANNETGVCQPVREIASLCRKRNILFHCDAVAAMGKMLIHLDEVECDLLSISGHKFHAPKGIGLLFIRKGTPIKPLFYGCGHQNGMRSGSQNTVATAAMARAADLILPDAAHVESRRLQLWNGIHDLCPSAQRNGGGGLLPNTLNVHFPGTPSSKLQAELASRGFSVAAGASASKGDASHVLLAMGLDHARAASSIRFSLGATTSFKEIEDLLKHLSASLDAIEATQPAEMA